MTESMILTINNLAAYDQVIVKNQGYRSAPAILADSYSSSSMSDREYKKRPKVFPFWPLSIARQVMIEIETQRHKYNGIY